MIPLKIELKNFLSYGDTKTTIDFEDHSLICLSGKNGNGKSALLDAMTWAVWGQARKISGTIKPDAGLLRLGQTRMIVSFQFLFNQQVYKVRREFAKTYGKPHAALDFEVFDRNCDKFISLTDKTIKLTQEKIEKLLGLDYQTFTNSAFLRQGLADEFSKKSPKERKNILSNILGFAMYDELQSRALEKSKQVKDECKLITGLKSQADEEIQKKEEIAAKHTQVEKEIKEIEKEGKKLSETLQKTEKEKTVLIEKKQKHELLGEEKSKVLKSIEQKQGEFQRLVVAWKKIFYKTLALPNIKDLEAEKERLIAQEKTYLHLQQKSLALQGVMLQTKEKYQQLVNQIKREQSENLHALRFRVEKKELTHKQQVELLENKIKREKELKKSVQDRQKELGEIKKDLEGAKAFEDNFKKLQNQFEKRRAFYQSWIQKGNWVKAQLQEFSEKDGAMQGQTSPSCPLCEQVLTAKRKQFLRAKFKKEGGFLSKRLDRISFLIAKLKKILIVQHETLEKETKKRDEYKKQEMSFTQLEKEIAKLEQELKTVVTEIMQLKKVKEETQEKIKKEKQSLGALEKQCAKDIDTDVKVKEVVTELKKIGKEQGRLKYDKKTHEALQKQIHDIETNLKDLSDTKTEQVAQKDRKNKIALLASQLKEHKQSVVAFVKKVKVLSFDIKMLQEIERKHAQHKKDIDKKQGEKDKKLQELGTLKNELKRIERLEKQNKERSEKVAVLQEDVKDYHTLSQAFGKNGIQALLIEQAIPQIEEEANNILARLTDNQAQVFIESLRDLKSGGVKETLDIQISDAAGIRPYEMFSGGEAFRVDFALRIAISKLLARRAGTALQTLIIDEGFGSQDEEGLSRLMDAIYAIKKDFSKVIVVSHLTSFKDNFPVHFVVNKNAQGSYLRIEQRG